jgi:hypothetical protein
MEDSLSAGKSLESFLNDFLQVFFFGGVFLVGLGVQVVKWVVGFMQSYVLCGDFRRCAFIGVWKG